jgi:membrane protein DedA with SNARE-associated domain/membrane-associated phospholipid phosphatase
MEGFLIPLLEWIAANPHWAGFIAFNVALLESLALVGLILPGAVILFGVGAVVSTGAMPLVPTLAWVAAGAIAGDTISFWLGRHFHQHLRVVWPFRRYPRLISRGIDFFYKHGGKSVLMARFVGPVRPVIPAVAGMLDMPVLRFLAVDLFAALLWAPAYILPGVVFGASLDLAAEVAGRLVVLLLVVIGLVWFSLWLVSRIVRALQPHTTAIVMRALDWSRNHPVIRPMAGALLDPAHPEARGLAQLALIMLLATWLFLLILRQVTQGALLVHLDLYLFHFFEGLRAPWGDRTMVFFTRLGDPALLFILTVAGALWLIARARARAAYHWLAAFACTWSLTRILKLTSQVPRPTNILDSFAFPSGHTSISTVTYGFLAVIIARELQPARRWVPYTGAALVIVPIALSRLYLGVHWVTDVLGGLTLGLFWLALMGIAYRRHPGPAVGIGGLLGTCALTLALAAGWQFQTRYDGDLQRYAVVRPSPQTVPLDVWLQNGWRTLPAYRHDLEGKARQPLNVQWAGRLDTLKAALLAHGWYHPPGLDAAGMLSMLAGEPRPRALPVLPQVHDGQHEALHLVRGTDDPERLLILRFWSSGVQLQRDGLPIWIGTVSGLRIERRLHALSFLGTTNEYNSPLWRLEQDLGDSGLSRMLRERHPGNGGGSVLLIWAEAATASQPGGGR